MANPIAVPGTVVPSGSLTTPGGAQGVQGPTAISTDANNKATIGSDALILVSGTASGASATTHAQTVSGDDPQLTNARTPTAHQASHVTGSDQIPSATTGARGLLSILSGDLNQYFSGNGNWARILQAAMNPIVYGSPSFAGNVSLDCTGATSVSANLVCAGTGSLGLNYVALGVPISVFIYNNAAASITVTVPVTNPSGTAYGVVQGCHNGAVINLGSGGLTLTTGQGFVLNGISIYTAAIGYKMEFGY